MSVKIRSGSISDKYLREFLTNVNFLITKGQSVISVKKIRQYHNIKPSNKSKINFYFRFLGLLEKEGYIKLINHRPPKRYKLPKKQINIEKIFYKLKSKKK